MIDKSHDKYKPAMLDPYYAIVGSNITGEYYPKQFVFDGSIFDLQCYAAGNCFRTYCEAKQAKESVVNLLKAVFDC